ncbi:hypothetical protein [Priestia megaterium]|uniref:hypothetical protein n=1 Tax=Priestia megaterium TaxID=1404 RepID=UPI002E1D1BC7|nr:hypothetical protein [Priestia megaterium]
MIIINKYYNKLAYFHNGYIEKVYDKVQMGTPVAITYSYKSFVDLTKVYNYELKDN